MQHLLFHTIAPFFLVLPLFANAQDLEQLGAASYYHFIQPGPEKIKRVRELERKGWYHQFTGYDLKGKPMETPKIDLAPVVDDMGETVFLVTDVAPEFPGGKVSLNDYLQNSLGDLLAKPGEGTQNSLYVKFYVTKDGKIEAVEPAQPFPEWVPATTPQRCMDAVSEMPTWSPGRYKNRPVKVNMLMVFSLRE
ncbi:MAG: hypothetical protein ACKVU0_16195 [Saprospiraceae bacterium]